MQTEEKEILNLIQQIHASPYRIVLSVTGGGSEAISELVRHGNGSATLLEALVPYDRDALIGFIGSETDSYCSEETARKMAMASFERALKLSENKRDVDAKHLLGIGVTCKLVRSGAEREGRKHEIYFASQSLLQTTATHLTLSDKRTREEEEYITALLIIYRIAQLCNVDISGLRSFSMASEFKNIVNKSAEVSLDIGKLLKDTLLRGDEVPNQAINIMTHPVTSLNNKATQPKMVFAGSFNPCHKNHIVMAKTAFYMYGFPICPEISLANVDKPPIDFISLENRLKSLEKHMSEEFMGDIYLTNTPLFADKATLFPSSCFLIGADTLNRTFNEKYYRQDETKESLLEHLKALGIHFLIFRRKNVEFSMDEDIKQICKVVKLSDYEDDGTSSSQIRKKSMEIS